MRIGVQQRMKTVTTITNIGTMAFIWDCVLSSLITVSGKARMFLVFLKIPSSDAGLLLPDGE